jgi:hypothetical protein
MIERSLLVRTLEKTPRSESTLWNPPSRPRYIPAANSVIIGFKATSRFRNATYRMTSFFNQDGFTLSVAFVDDSQLG